MTHDRFCLPHFYVSWIFNWPSRSSGLNFAPVWHLLVVNVPEINWKWFHILSCQNSIDGTLPHFFSSFSSALRRRNSWSTPSLSSFFSPLRSELICHRWHSCRTVSTSTASSGMEQRIDSLGGSRYAFWDQMKSPKWILTTNMQNADLRWYTPEGSLVNRSMERPKRKLV